MTKVTSSSTYKITWHHSLQDWNLNLHCRENHKSHTGKTSNFKSNDGLLIQNEHNESPGSPEIKAKQI